MDSGHHPNPADIALTVAGGSPVKFGDFKADPLIVVLVRYFGCLPCQNYLRDLDVQLDRFDAGARVVAVGGSTDRQAQWLQENKGVTMPLVIDPDQQIRSLVDLGNLTPLQLAKTGGWANYARAMGNGFRPQIPTKHAQSAPGIAIFDSNFETLWVHRGEMMGDYPPIDELVDIVSSLPATN
jgi:peroxiredoxin